MDHLTPSQERSLRRAEAIRWASEIANHARSVDKSVPGEKDMEAGHTDVGSAADRKDGKEDPAKDDHKESSQKGEQG